MKKEQKFLTFLLSTIGATTISSAIIKNNNSHQIVNNYENKKTKNNIGNHIKEETIPAEIILASVGCSSIWHQV